MQFLSCGAVVCRSQRHAGRTGDQQSTWILAHGVLDRKRDTVGNGTNVIYFRFCLCPEK